jgi:hypothetical protein
MKKLWTQGLEEDAAKEMRSHFLSGLILRKRLIKILLDKEIEASKNGRSKAGYDCPNWAYKQADMSGYTRALHDIISYLED